MSLSCEKRQIPTAGKTDDIFEKKSVYLVVPLLVETIEKANLPVTKNSEIVS
jgi:hypothetical protein